MKKKQEKNRKHIEESIQAAVAAVSNANGFPIWMFKSKANPFASLQSCAARRQQKKCYTLSMPCIYAYKWNWILALKIEFEKKEEKKITPTERLRKVQSNTHPYPIRTYLSFFLFQRNFDTIHRYLEYYFTLFQILYFAFILKWKANKNQD